MLMIGSISTRFSTLQHPPNTRKRNSGAIMRLAEGALRDTAVNPPLAGTKGLVKHAG